MTGVDALLLRCNAIRDASAHTSNFVEVVQAVLHISFLYRDAARVAQAYTLDTKWRNRIEWCKSRQEAQDFLRRKWEKELDYRLIKELWAVDSIRLAVRCALF
jgi:nuclear transport factor 2 (NTF2) superfamily protein